MAAYTIERLDDVALAAGPPLDGMDLMSPFVWCESDRYRIMVRGVPRPLLAASPTGLIWCGRGEDGLHFRMDEKPAIVPGPDRFDAGGCEDPTVLIGAKKDYLVFYTGVDAARDQGALLIAEGANINRLAKQEVTLKAPPGAGNIKEATLAQTSKGDWRLFYEYAADDASRVGLATGPTPKGPWTVVADPFGIREDSWDNWHLSTGPIAAIGAADPVMFYNGATHDARWRVGWISFDRDYERVTGRGLEPLIVPPPAKTRAEPDIAFAASAVVEDDGISLYFSIEDRLLRRARVRRYD